jgi:DNA-binding NarL/FixJ family response regulator
MMRVLVVAQRAGTAQALGRVLQRDAHNVIAYLDGQRAGGPLVSQSRPDVVLIDELAGGEGHLDTVATIRAAAPAAKLVLLTGRMDPERLAVEVRAGIDAAMSKTLDPAHFRVLLHEVAAGTVFHAFTPAVMPMPGPLLAGHLTGREAEVLRLVASGTSNRRIARHLSVTEQTVKFHLSNVYRKLGVSNRTEASHLAHVHGLFEEPLVDAAA